MLYNVIYKLISYKLMRLYRKLPALRQLRLEGARVRAGTRMCARCVLVIVCACALCARDGVLVCSLRARDCVLVCSLRARDFVRMCAVRS
jgi:hypothetical protein